MKAPDATFLTTDSLPWYWRLPPTQTFKAIEKGELSVTEFTDWARSVVYKERAEAYDLGFNAGMEAK